MPSLFRIVEIHAQTIEEVWRWAFNVDATAVVLPPPDIVETLELDLRVLAFDLVDSDEDETCQVVTAVEVQSIVVDDNNFFLDTEDNEVSGVGCTIYTRWWQPHTVDFNVSCLHTSFGCKC